MLSKILTAKAAAAATVLAFGVGTAAAAATGSLPGQTSHANSHATAGLAVAASHTAAGTNGKNQAPGHPASNTTPGNIPATGPANIHAQFGLCQAFLAGQQTSSTGSSNANPPQYQSTAFKALIGEHGGVTGTTTYCKGLAKTHSSSGTDDNSTDTGKPTNAGKPSGAGHPATTPATTRGHAPVSTPNSGGTSTANTASGGASSSGTSTANTASGGASSAGAGNAAGRP